MLARRPRDDPSRRRTRLVVAIIGLVVLFLVLSRFAADRENTASPPAAELRADRAGDFESVRTEESTRLAESVSEPAPVSSAPAALEIVTRWSGDLAPAAELAFVARVTEIDGRSSTFRGRTDAAGLARIESPGRATARVELPLHEVEGVAELHPGETARLELLVAGDHEIRILAVDETDRPVEGARIWAAEGSSSLASVELGATDERGTLVTRGLDRHVGLIAFHPGHLPSEMLRLPIVDAPPLVVLTLPSGTPALVGGLVLDTQGAPVSGARVDVVSGKRAVTVIPDATGRFETPPILAGSWWIDASADGWTGGSDVSLAIVEGRNPPIERRLSRLAALVGTVRTPEGAPVGAALVRCGEEGRSSADGRFRIDGVRAGDRHRVSAEAPGFGSTEMEFEFAAGATVATCDLVLRRDGMIEGRVRSESGEPRIRHRVSAGPPNHPRQLSHRTSTDAEGHFAIFGCGAQPWTVVVELESAPKRFLVRVDDVLPGGPPIEIVVPNDALPSAWIVGTLDLHGGRYATAATVVAREDSGVLELPSAVDAATGRFAVGPLFPGAYRLRVEPTATSKAEPQWIAGRIELTPNQRLDLGTLRVAWPTARLTVEIAGLDRWMDETLHGYLTPRQGRSRQAKVASSSVEFAHLAAGPYSLRFEGMYSLAAEQDLELGEDEARTVFVRLDPAWARDIVIESGVAKLANCTLTIVGGARRSTDVLALNSAYGTLVHTWSALAAGEYELVVADATREWRTTFVVDASSPRRDTLVLRLDAESAAPRR